MHTPPVYLVVGWMRSGTSMMMHALKEGGMTVTSSPEREAFGQASSDAHYQVNPGGMFELPIAALEAPDFPGTYVGRVVKVVIPWLHVLKSVEGLRYKILFMHRDSEEIRQDYEAAFDRRVTCQTIDAQVRDGLRGLQARADMDLLVVPYRSIVFHPAFWMQQIRWAGWPIDPTKAATVVQESLYTFRREALTVGL